MSYSNDTKPSSSYSNASENTSSFTNDVKQVLGSVATWANILTTWATETATWASVSGGAGYTNDTKN